MATYDVAIVGLGDLAGHVLELLARVPAVQQILVADIDTTRGPRKVNLAILGASYADCYPKIDFVECDVRDINRTTELLAKAKPRVIFNATTLQSWWVIDNAPQQLRMRLGKIGVGPWMPMHLTLTHALMQAVRTAGLNSHVVNASFPDAVNAALGKVRLNPTVGIGNCDLLVPRIRKLTAGYLRVPMREVRVELVAHHSTLVSILENGEPGTPYFLRIAAGASDVTEELDLAALFRDIRDSIPIPRGTGVHPLVASSAVRVILALLLGVAGHGHAPGPRALPGGYPITTGPDGVDVLVPSGLTLAKMIDLNRVAQRWDGIEEIREDGSTVFTQEAAEVMRETLAYDCPVLSIEESWERAMELRTKYQSALKAAGVA